MRDCDLDSLKVDSPLALPSPPYRTLPRAAPTMADAMGATDCHKGARVSEVGNALDEQRFTPPKIEVRPSASGARRRGATLEVAR